MPSAIRLQRSVDSAYAAVSAVRTSRSSGLSVDSGDGTSPAFSYSTPRCSSRVASPPSSRIMLGCCPSGHCRICWVHHQYSATAVTPPCCCTRSEEHTSELQSLRHLVCRLLLEKKKNHNE